MHPPTIGQAEGSVVNFGSHSRGVEPVAGSNVSIDYAYYLGRRDLLYATAQEVRRLEGAASDDPKLPAPAENTLPLGAIDCPPNSLALAVTNFGITRVTMQQLHGVLRDVEALKYNDAQFQQLLVLQNRNSQTFSFPMDRVLSAMGLTFGAKDAVHPLTVQIRGVTAGVPNEQVLAQRTLSPPEVALNTETKVAFENPVFLQHGNSYAVVIMTRSNAYYRWAGTRHPDTQCKSTTAAPHPRTEGSSAS
jgi:hypothetical protein